MSSPWIMVAEYSGIEEDETLTVEHEDAQICLYKVGGEIFATDNKCTHGDADLSEGLLQDGHFIECPLHEGTFDIRTGAPVGLPCTEALRCHEVRIDAGSIFLRARLPRAVNP
jgi:nitrite reductase/ring-hydroxylating ferredoxin subunit